MRRNTYQPSSYVRLLNALGVVCVNARCEFLQGDLFGNSGKDNTQGMLYLSRMDPSRDPKKARLDTTEEQKRRSLAQLGIKEGEDSTAEHEVGEALLCIYRLEK